ncbi:hypothetical protein HDA32_005362 [Spinactinospora alkalitolerans]|uniref:Uncharacterized protein n=1 Tax=Spinactinospora alkalitolerans TaxID=687207 RepID=A0A852U435_9ACTN|nr:hypothetical protein [Spinactinospora alkalitolerans]NYE50242.1 hypothetical protein [Spinactinospora alkalitolerans]
MSTEATWIDLAEQLEQIRREFEAHVADIYAMTTSATEEASTEPAPPTSPT